MDADLGAATAAAAALAAAPRYKLPQVKAPVGQAQYADLSRVVLKPQAATGGFGFDATGSYPRMPAPSLPPRPVPITSCPEGNSVKAFGASGNGYNNDARAILLANAATQLDFIYFPPGNYRIARNITVTKPILGGAGAKLAVAAGFTLVISRRVYQNDVSSALFTGPGAVKLGKYSDEVRPPWFKNVERGETDDVALQEAVDSCGAACTLLLNAPTSLMKAVNLKPRVGLFSTPAAIITGGDPGSRGEGFVLTPGLYRKPIVLTIMWWFSKFGVKIQGGVTGAQIQVHGFLEASEAFSFAPQEGSKPNISNVHVTHMTFTSDVQDTVAFHAGASNHLINNCLVRGNFVLKSGFQNPAAPSAALALKGAAAGRLAKTFVDFQAVDAAQFLEVTDCSFVRNEVAAPVSNVVFRVAAWGGGLETGAGKLVVGQFSSLKYLSRMSGGVPSNPIEATLLGSSNYVGLWDVGSAGREWVMASAKNRTAFNSGVSMVSQVHYLRAEFSGPWQPGEARTFYFYNAFARSAGTRIKCLPFRAGNAGLVCSQIENQSATSEDQVAVTLKNTASYTLPDWQTFHRFGIQAQPGDASPTEGRPVLEADVIIDPEGHIEQRPTTLQQLAQPAAAAEALGQAATQPLTADEKRLLWKQAIKLPMYSVGVMPILVSAAAVFLQTNSLNLGRTLLFMLAATCIIAWLNLTNDVFDSHTGVDKADYKPESVVNLTGSRIRVAIVAFALLGLGGLILQRLLSTLAEPLAGKMLAAAVAMGYLYQGPPFRFSYLGLGEPLCFAAFGPLATCAFYLAQAPAGTTIGPMIIGLSLLIGLTTTTILFCSHFHQIEGDRAHGKMSPLVRLGGEKATQVLKFVVGLTHTLALAMSIFGVLPLACWTSVMVSYGFANRMVKHAQAHWAEPETVKTLKFFAIKWHIAFGLMLVLGLLLQKIL
ncbi:hypothetical protein N2152v2_011050 [Parachlorella kessleri]